MKTTFKNSSVFDRTSISIAEHVHLSFLHQNVLIIQKFTLHSFTSTCFSCIFFLFVYYFLLFVCVYISSSVASRLSDIFNINAQLGCKFAV